MSTATMRLRRAGAGGLAAAVIAGTMFASAGSALAWNTGAAEGSVAVASTPVIAPGATGAGGAVTITLPKTWNIGDTINVSIAGADCTSAATTVAFAALPAVAAALGSGAPGTDTLPTFSVAATQNGAGCAAAAKNTGATITFTNDATNSVAPTLALTGHTFSVGASVPSGNLNLALATTGVATQPAFNGASATDAVISASSVLVSSATPVVVAPNTAGQAVPTVTVKEVLPATLTSAGGVTIAFSNATVDASNFGTTGTAKATWSGGGTLVVAATANPNEVKITGLTPTTTTAGTLTLSGVTIKPSAVALNTAAGLTVEATASGTGITGTPSATVAADVNTKNTGGSDRYFTAAALFNATAPANATDAILTTGSLYPDALSANTLAGSLGTGTLLTTPTTLSQAAALQIVAHKVNTVYILGGTGAVSAAVEAQVKALVINDAGQVNPNVIRLGGADRYATNNLVNTYADSTLGGGLNVTKLAVVATGENFADALAVGPEVVNLNAALILTPTAALNTSAQASLINLGIKNVVIVGGTGAVSANVESQIKALGIGIAYRLAGTDRTQTAAQIATWATLGVPAVGTTYAAQGSLGFSQTMVHVANGGNFPDALAAGPVAGAAAQVILLSNSPTSAGIGGPAFVTTLAGQTVPALIGTVNGLGLSGAVSSSVLNAFALGILG